MVHIHPGFEDDLSGGPWIPSERHGSDAKPFLCPEFWAGRSSRVGSARCVVVGSAKDDLLQDARYKSSFPWTCRTNTIDCFLPSFRGTYRFRAPRTATRICSDSQKSSRFAHAAAPLLVKHGCLELGEAAKLAA